jgi:hypothetical protein
MNLYTQTQLITEFSTIQGRVQIWFTNGTYLVGHAEQNILVTTL